MRASIATCAIDHSARPGNGPLFLFAQPFSDGPIATERAPECQIWHDTQRRAGASARGPQPAEPEGAGPAARQASALTTLNAQVPVTVSPRNAMVHASPSSAFAQALNASGGGDGGASARQASSPEGNTRHLPRTCCPRNGMVQPSPTARFTQAATAASGGGAANANGATPMNMESATMARADFVIADPFRSQRGAGVWRVDCRKMSICYETGDRGWCALKIGGAPGRTPARRPLVLSSTQRQA